LLVEAALGFDGFRLTGQPEQGGFSAASQQDFYIASHCQEKRNPDQGNRRLEAWRSVP